MARAISLIRRCPLPLACMMAAALVIGTAWSVAVAPLQGYDEDTHVAYVEHLAETASIPSPTTGDKPFGADQEQAVALFGLGALLQNGTARPDWSAERKRAFEEFENTLDGSERGAGEGPNGIAKNPPLYYAAQALVWKATPAGFLERLSVMRLTSVLIFVLTVALAWLLASEVFARTLPRTVAAGVVTLLPMAGYLGGIVNPDIATGAAWTAFLWLSLRTIRTGPSPGRVAILSAVAAAALLIHGRNVVIVPALLLSLAVAWYANRTSPRLILKGAVTSAVVMGFAALVIKLSSSGSGASGAYGGEAAFRNSSAFNPRQFLSSVWQFYFPKLSSMEPRLGPAYGFRQLFVEQFFGGSFGSNEVFFSYPTYDLVQVLLVLAGVGFYTIIVANWATVRSRWPAAVVCGGSTVLVVLFLHVASYRSLIGGSSDPLITGRYLMPLVGIFGLIAATLVAGVPRRLSPVLAGMILGALFVATTGGIAITLTRFYA